MVKVHMSEVCHIAFAVVEGQSIRMLTSAASEATIRDTTPVLVFATETQGVCDSIPPRPPTI